jgi:TRAP-type C4-dicarboxylate transport system permease small subunit
VASPGTRAMSRLISRLATLSALAGGAVLGGLVLMTCVSIVGRALSRFGTGPVRGDFELMEAGVAFVVFASLPLAQLRASHAVVDLFTLRLPPAATRALIALWEVLMAIVFVVILWRLAVGTGDKFGTGETSYLLRIPVWWAYAACLLPAGIAAITAAWSARMRIAEAWSGHDAPSGGGTA